MRSPDYFESDQLGVLENCKLPRKVYFYKYIPPRSGSSTAAVESEPDAVTTIEHSFAPGLTIPAGTPEKAVFCYLVAQIEAAVLSNNTKIGREQSDSGNILWTFDPKARGEVELYLQRNFGLERNDIDL